MIFLCRLFFFQAIDIFLVQVYSLQLVVEMRSGEVRSLRQQLAVANQQVTFLNNKIAAFDLFQPLGYFCPFFNKIISFYFFLNKIATFDFFQPEGNFFVEQQDCLLAPLIFSIH